MLTTPWRMRRSHWEGLATLGALFFVALLAVKWLTAAPPPRIKTAKVVRARMESSVVATGVLQAIRQVDVGTRVSGQLKSLRVKIGDRIREGQLLAEIDPILFENDLRAQKAHLEKLDAQRQATEARIHRLRLELKRQKGMISAAVTSRRDVEIAEAQTKEEDAALLALDAEMSQARAQIDIASANLGFTKITAPIDGEVVAVLTQEGQTVVAAQIVPVILKLAQLDAMTVRTQAPEADVIRLRVGQPATFTIMGDADRRFTGRLRVVEPAPQNFADSSTSGASSQSTSGTSAHPAVFYNALFDVPNPDHLLRIGMTAQVTIKLGDARNALTIPSSALRKAGESDGYEVKIVTPKRTIEKHAVRVGLDDFLRAEILEGLSEGETVVTEEANSKEEESE